MVGAVGTDAQALVGLEGLRAAGVDLAGVREVDGPTGPGHRHRGRGRRELHRGDRGGPTTAVDAAQVASARDVLAASAIVVCQGEIPREGIEALPDLVTGRFLHNPRRSMELDPEVAARLRPTQRSTEAALVLAQLAPAAAIPEAPEQIADALRAAGVASVVLTLGAQGSLAADADGLHRIPAAPVQAVDTTGAGDAFIGALAVGLARGEPLPAAARLASQVGAFAATGHGAQPSYPSAEDDLPPLAEVSA